MKNFANMFHSPAPAPHFTCPFPSLSLVSCLLHTHSHTTVKMSTQLTHTCAQTFCRTFRWKFNNSGETLDVGSERFSVNGSRSILKYTPVTDQVNTAIRPLFPTIYAYTYICICLAMSTVEAEVSSGQLSKSRILNNK